MKYLYQKLIPCLLLAATFSGCKLEGDVLPPGVVDSGTVNTPITAEYYFKGTLNNKTLLWQVTTAGNDWTAGSAAAVSNDQGNITGSLTGYIGDVNTQTPQIGVEFRTYQYIFGTDKPAYFNGFVTSGTWLLATEQTTPPEQKYVVITYTDSSGKAYTSVGTQTGNSVSIVSVTQVPASLGTAEGLKIKLKFNCSLYPVDGTGSPVPLKNAEATIFLEDLL